MNKAGAILALLLPVLIWALSYIQRPTFHSFYREILPMFYPSAAVMWVLSFLELFLPQHALTPLALDSPHLRLVRHIRIGLYCAGFAIFILYTSLGSGANRPAGVLMLAVLSAAMALDTYINYRKLPSAQMPTTT